MNTLLRVRGDTSDKLEHMTTIKSRPRLLGTRIGLSGEEFSWKHTEEVSGSSKWSYASGLWVCGSGTLDTFLRNIYLGSQ